MQEVNIGGISKGYPHVISEIQQTNRILIPSIQNWNMQNKNLQGIPSQKKSHMGIYITWGQGFFAEQ